MIPLEYEGCKNIYVIPLVTLYLINISYNIFNKYISHVFMYLACIQSMRCEVYML